MVAVTRGAKRIVQIDDDEGFVGEDVRERPDDGDALCSGEDAARIEGGGAVEKIICGIAVEQSTDAGTFGVEIGIADDDQAFYFVGDVEKSVEQVNALLFVFRDAGAERINSQRGRRCDGESVFCRDVKTLADGRDGRSDYALGESLVVDVGDVVDAQAAWSVGRVGVFTASLNIEDVAGVIGDGGQLAMAGDKFFEIVGIGDALEVAAINGFRLVVLGDGNGFEPALAGGDVNVAAHEIHEVGALE